jgi:hypothetical protein
VTRLLPRQARHSIASGPGRLTTVHEQHVSIDFWPDPNEPSSDSYTLATIGQLSPGVYELEIVADVDCLYMYLQTYGEPVELVAEASFVVDLTFTPAEPPPDCDDADTDDDGDVDLLDFYRFQRCYTGSVTLPAAVLRYAFGGLAPVGGVERVDELQGGSRSWRRGRHERKRGRGFWRRLRRSWTG